MIKIFIESLGNWIYILIIVSQVLIYIFYTIMIYFLTKNNKKYVLISTIIYSSLNYMVASIWIVNWTSLLFMICDVFGVSIGTMTGMFFSEKLEKILNKRKTLKEE
jgi:hypothetical protein